jgi:hypothetical protein
VVCRALSANETRVSSVEHVPRYKRVVDLLSLNVVVVVPSISSCPRGSDKHVDGLVLEAEVRWSVYMAVSSAPSSWHVNGCTLAVASER